MMTGHGEWSWVTWVAVAMCVVTVPFWGPAMGKLSKTGPKDQEG